MDNPNIVVEQNIDVMVDFFSKHHLSFQSIKYPTISPKFGRSFNLNILLATFIGRMGKEAIDVIRKK
jgi:hypothetical protein